MFLSHKFCVTIFTASNAENCLQYGATIHAATATPKQQHINIYKIGQLKDQLVHMHRYVVTYNTNNSSMLRLILGICMVWIQTMFRMSCHNIKIYTFTILLNSWSQKSTIYNAFCYISVYVLMCERYKHIASLENLRQFQISSLICAFSSIFSITSLPNDSNVYIASLLARSIR